jgi:hypothetical protein
MKPTSIEKIIYEMPIFCGRLKEWRVLNLNTGTVYPSSFEFYQQAADSIEDRKVRGEYLVQKVENLSVIDMLDAIRKID